MTITTLDWGGQMNHEKLQLFDLMIKRIRDYLQADELAVFHDLLADNAHLVDENTDLQNAVALRTREIEVLRRRLAVHNRDQDDLNYSISQQ
jgi:hypothetical protein